jgi:hypothetical protein
MEESTRTHAGRTILRREKTAVGGLRAAPAVGRWRVNVGGLFAFSARACQREYRSWFHKGKKSIARIGRATRTKEPKHALREEWRTRVRNMALRMMWIRFRLIRFLLEGGPRHNEDSISLTEQEHDG